MRRFLSLAILSLFVLPLCTIAAEECFDCHDKYKKSNHGKLDCVVCHNDIKDLPHADKLAKPACTSCHAEAAKSFQASVHSDKGFKCSGCHNVHTPARDTKTCASCHSRVVHKTLPSAQKHLAELECSGCHARAVQGRISVKVDSKQSMAKDTLDKDGNKFVDVGEWKDFLVHSYSMVKDSYRIKRVYSVAGSAHNIGAKAISCNGCHVENKVFRKATLEVNAAGQHFSMGLDPHSVIPRLPMTDLYGLTSHGKSGVLCQDCHVSQERIDDGVCARCHAKVYGVYKGTKHAKGTAAYCTDCHDPHKVKTYRELGTGERISVCARCHTNYMEKHRWLPHAELHFMYLECSTCHSPQSEKGMVFNVSVGGEEGKRKLTYDDVAAAFGSRKRARNLIDVNGDGRIVSSEIVPFFEDLKKKTQGKVGIEGSIVVTGVYHDYSQVQKRDKVCATCHSEDAPFYQSMYLVLPEEKGFSYMPVKGTVLSTVPSSLGVNFFLLGETKMRWSDVRALLGARGEARRELLQELGFRWVDIAGIFLCLAALFLVCIHIILRVVFRR